MSWALGAAIYVIIWWMLLFTILPIGIRSQHEAKEVVPGSDPGAPVLPQLGKKLLATTLIAAILWGIADFAYIHYYLQP